MPAGMFPPNGSYFHRKCLSAIQTWSACLFTKSKNKNTAVS